MKEFIKGHKLLVTTLIIGLPCLIFMVLSFSTNLALENNNLSNILTLGFFLVPIFALYWLSFIKNKWSRIISMMLFGLVLLPFYAVSSLAIIFTANDVFKMNNNGYRAIHEVSIGDNDFLVIYRTPDKGGLGGDFINTALVKKFGLGIITRDFTKQIDYNHGFGTDEGTILYQGKEYIVPPLIEIEPNGNLK